MANTENNTFQLTPPLGGWGAGLLIFGGTTEGRLAVDVCEQAGKPFYYSTKSSTQDVEMHNGVRLTGAMTADDIKAFCAEHDIKAIIDAAHPFAENLHAAIAASGLPVIRLQRLFGKHIDGAIYCKDYNDAITRMEQDGINSLLALSGANTISKLKPFWQHHPTTFRILNRKESKDIARRNGLSEENIIYYNCDNTLPTEQQERDMMRSRPYDAIITKESGTNGGFNAKVNAALSLGLKVYIIQHPSPNTQNISLPSQERGRGERHEVSGPHTLRRAIQQLVPDFFPLKTGLTTGACATAATKAAALSLLTGDCPEEVCFALPNGEILTIPVECTTPGTATATKDWSDDPDVLRGCKITSQVTYHNEKSNLSPPPGERQGGEAGVLFLQGKGVGTVTLPGLGIPVGEPAINPTPRRMIENELHQLLSTFHFQHSLPPGGVGGGSFTVTISVENGEELAKKTFNHKVGVVGGISIIGTSGIVSPLSNEAFISSIRRELEVAWAIDCREIGLVAGLKSERALLADIASTITQQDTSLPSPRGGAGGRGFRCIHYGNFIGAALQSAHEIGFRNVTLAIMIGKAVKLAEGHLDTHSHKVAMNKEFLKTLTTPEHHHSIDSITMARELWDVMPPEFFNTIKARCYEHCRSVFPDGTLNIMLCNIK